MLFVKTIDAPIPAGHYSQAVIANGFIFVSGMLPIIPNSGVRLPEGIVAQTEQVFKNLELVLKAANSDLNRLVNVQLFIPRIEFWTTINQIYAKTLGLHKPARTVIPCGELHYGALIEVNAIAIVGENELP